MANSLRFVLPTMVTPFLAREPQAGSVFFRRLRVLVEILRSRGGHLSLDVDEIFDAESKGLVAGLGGFIRDKGVRRWRRRLAETPTASNRSAKRSPARPTIARIVQTEISRHDLKFEELRPSTRQERRRELSYSRQVYWYLSSLLERQTLTSAELMRLARLRFSMNQVCRCKCAHRYHRWRRCL